MRELLRACVDVLAVLTLSAAVSLLVYAIFFAGIWTLLSAVSR